MKNPLNAVVVFGSSRSHGNTLNAVQKVQQQLGFELPLINLADINVSEFHYEFSQQDDFPALIQQLLEYDLIILSTPVYWYSVSAKMKCFINRLSDLLIIDKPSGRCLKDKKLAVISSYSTHPEGIDGFEPPLKNTANYFGMFYLGAYFHYCGEDAEGIKASEISLKKFITHLQALIAVPTTTSYSSP